MSAVSVSTHPREGAPRWQGLALLFAVAALASGCPDWGYDNSAGYECDEDAACSDDGSLLCIEGVCAPAEWADGGTAEDAGTDAGG